MKRRIWNRHLSILVAMVCLMALVAGCGGGCCFRSDRQPIGWTGTDRQRCALRRWRLGCLPEYEAEPSAHVGAAVRCGPQSDGAPLSCELPKRTTRGR